MLQKQVSYALLLSMLCFSGVVTARLELKNRIGAITRNVDVTDASIEAQEEDDQYLCFGSKYLRLVNF